ncbi:MAG: chemotaxis response regulator protein-glutamate methylesterase [Spirochaetes bacterium]|nr:chemotaxis response regulator protein-glutamate methylesterase [Spirochaetota bacterium]
MSGQIRVLVVDDSSLVRKVITDILESDPLIKVVGTAENGEAAVTMAGRLDPDVITMDIEMPVLDGLTALRRIIAEKPRPVIMMSVFTQHGAEETFKALEFGAVDFVPKPSSMLSLSTGEIGEQLRSKVKSVYQSRVAPLDRSTFREARREAHAGAKQRAEAPPRVFDQSSSSPRIVAIGTSTGGPAALMHVFSNFPEHFPSPILVVQHMPEGFTRAFAERLDAISPLKVKEAEDMDPVVPGGGYIAPGDSHISIELKNKRKYVRVFKGDKVSGHRPSIDVLFGSMASVVGKDTIAVIMTGMGRDGAEGIVRIREAGGRTIAQDEGSSIVFGMNRVAVEKGAVHDIVPLSEIPKKIVEYI